MYKCKSCGEVFDVAAFYCERHGFTSGPAEEFPICPNCGSEWFEVEGLDPHSAFSLSKNKNLYPAR